jgi:4-amino-4-deoxy-L-arabinose transferase-like glycosyltransferase
MSDKSADANNLPPAGSTGKQAFVYLILVALFALFFNLGGRPIEAKDYLRYAEIAREILEFDDWVMMHHEGKIYVDKPPLHFWLMAGSYGLFGVNSFAARLPSAVAAFCGVLLIFFFARRIFGSTQTAFLAAIILLSAYDFLWWARRTRIDMMFSVLFSVSLVCFYCGCETTSNRRRVLWYMAFWLATGFAFMDKAFIALANLVVAIPYCVTVMRKPQGRKISPGLFAITSLSLLLPVLPWIIAMINHPEFSAYREILDQTKIMDRQEEFYFYLIQMPLKLLPATPFLIMGIWGYFRYRKQLSHSRALGFALLWILSYLFILHLTVAKNTRYLLPLYLPCSLVSAWAIGFFLDNQKKILATFMQWSDRILLGAAALSIAFPFVVAYHYKITLLPALLYAVVIAVAFLTARKFLPFKAAGLFVSFIFVLLIIDVGDTVGREKASAYYRMSLILKAENLKPAEIAYHSKCFNRAQKATGFYFNKLIRCSESWPEMFGDREIRAIVTTRQAIEEEIPPKDINNRGRIIPCDKGYVIYLKPQ